MFEAMFLKAFTPRLATFLTSCFNRMRDKSMSKSSTGSGKELLCEPYRSVGAPPYIEEEYPDEA